MEEALRQLDYALIQVYVELGRSWSGAPVALLRKMDCRLGGLWPIWFGSDGSLMLRHFVDPDLDGLKIFSDRGRRLVEMVRDDLERN
jgi:hypothetical protein